MTHAKKESGAATPETVETPERISLEELVADLSPGAKAIAPHVRSLSGMRSGRVAGLSGRRALVLMRGFENSIEVELGPGVESDVIADAMHAGDHVLVEFCEGEEPLVMGVLQTKRPRELRLKAATVHIEGEEEIVLRSGKGAIRIRSDGDMEVVGSRISAASRGLFRIVGRMLRLN